MGSRISDPRAYAAKAKFNDPDQPSYHQAMNGEHASEYVEAMKKESNQTTLSSEHLDSDPTRRYSPCKTFNNRKTRKAFSIERHVGVQAQTSTRWEAAEIQKQILLPWRYAKGRS